MTDAPNTVLRDGLLQPGPPVDSRTFVKGVAAVVTPDRTYKLLHNWRLYQTQSGHYEIVNPETGGVLARIPIADVMWLVPLEKPGYFDWRTRKYYYHEE